MKKDEFNLLETMEQVGYFNSLLAEGQTLTQITHSLDIGRTTIARNFKKISYAYNSTTKQYVESNVTQNLKDNNSPKIDSNKKLANRPDHKLKDRPMFNIPIKTSLKATTKAFNVVMDKVLVDKIDKLAKAKGGYSRNQIINKMVEFAIDNMN